MKKQMKMRMLSLAAEKFNGVFDKGGEPYLLHCIEVMNRLNTDDEELQCIALGHDLFEDTGVVPLDLINMDFSMRIVHGIDMMTKWPFLSQEEYEDRVLSNPDSILVKEADLSHNSDIRRLKGVSEKDIQRMIKYHKFFLRIKAKKTELGLK